MHSNWIPKSYSHQVWAEMQMLTCFWLPASARKQWWPWEFYFIWMISKLSVPVGCLHLGQCQGQCSVFVLRKCQSQVLTIVGWHLGLKVFHSSPELWSKFTLKVRELTLIKWPDVTVEGAEIQNDKVFTGFWEGLDTQNQWDSLILTILILWTETGNRNLDASPSITCFCFLIYFSLS